MGAPVTASMIGDLMASISSIFKDRAVGLEGVDIAYLPNVHDIIPALAEKSPGLKRMRMEVDFDPSASGAGTDEGVLRNVPEIRAKFPELETLMLVFEDTRRDFAFLPPREIRIVSSSFKVPTYVIPVLLVPRRHHLLTSMEFFSSNASRDWPRNWPCSQSSAGFPFL